MPYISQDQRTNFLFPRNPGQLNYELTTTIAEYLALKGLNYQTINDVIGALECTKLEFYRRIAVPYEDQKLRENGDVYATAQETLSNAV